MLVTCLVLEVGTWGCIEFVTDWLTLSNKGLSLVDQEKSVT